MISQIIKKIFGYFKNYTYLCIVKLNNIKTMETRDIVIKLAELLHKDEGVYDGAVCFDWSSYDLDEDIPYLIIKGERIKIEEFKVNKEGNIIKVLRHNDLFLIDEWTLNLDECTFTEQDFEDMGMYALLNSVYYETDYSWEIGDFELDFLKEE